MRPGRIAATAVAALVAGGGAAALALTSDHESSPVVTAVLGLLLGWSFVGTGLIAAARNPRNRTGLLMIAVGFAWFLGALADADHPVPYAVWLVIGNLFLAVFGQLLLSYPRGRLTSPAERAFVALAYFAALSANFSIALVTRHPVGNCDDCPRNVLFVHAVPEARTVLLAFWDTIGVAVVGAVIVILVGRWRAATPAARRALGPVWVAGITTMTLLGIVFATEPVASGVSDAIGPVAILAFLSVPYFFLGGLVRSRLARTAATQLLLETPERPTVEEAQAGLRRALHDPTLRLFVWLDEAQAYVDAEGREVEPPSDGNGSVTSAIEYDGRPLAAVTHDRSLRYEEPALLEDVLAAARVALEKDRGLRALQASERRQRALLEALPDYMFRIRRDGTYLDVHAHAGNDAHAGAGFIGTNVRDHLPAGVAEELVALIERVVDTGEPGSYEHDLEVDGNRLAFESRVVKSGVDEVLAIVRDVTDRKRQEDELRGLYAELADRIRRLERERDFTRSVVNIAPTYFCVVDTEGFVVRFNATLERASGHSDGESARRHRFWELFGLEEEADELRQAVLATAGEGDKRGWTSSLRGASGERRTVSWWSTPVQDEDGRDRILLCGLDVTEERRHEDELRRERDFLSLVARATPSILALLEDDGTIGERGVNRAFAEITGYDDPRAIGRDLAELVVAPEDRESFRAALAAGPGPWHEHTWISRDGRRTPVEWTVSPLTTYRPGWHLLCAIDVSERRRQEARNRALLDALPDLMFRIRRDGTYVDYHVHQDSELLTPEVVGRTVHDRLPPEVAERALAAAGRALDEGGVQAYEYELHLHGERRSYEARVVASGESEVVSIVRDITDAKRREAEIRALAEEQAALRRVAVAVAREQQPEEVFAVVTEELGRLLRADRASMLRFESKDEDEIAVLATWSRNGSPRYPTGRRLKLWGGPVARVRETGGLARVEADCVPDHVRERMLEQGIASAISAPITVSGRLWGAVTISLEDSTFPPDAEQRVGNFAELTAIALANAEAREQLAASRARIVRAGDEERRRLERNLHDGAQQRLVSLSLSLRLAQAKLGTDDAAAREILAGASAELALALEELRELARGLHPAILTDRGLAAALESLAGRTTLPVELESVPDERLPPAVEAAAFYVVSEALANVAKYARAESVKVRVERRNGLAVIEVADDGVGGADPERGSGLRGLGDRVEALDGRIDVDSTPGHGTRIRAVIPCES